MSACHRAVALFFASLFSTQLAAEAPVLVESASTRNLIRQVSVNGTVTSPRTAVLSTAVGGLVAELRVDQGHRVETTDELLSLDAELAELAYSRFRAEVRQSETALADAKRRLADAEKLGTARGMARTTIESLRAEVASNDASLAASMAAAREQEARVRRHTLTAPFAGVISERLTELGEWVNPGDGLLELVATTELRVDFRVSQDFFSDLGPETRIEITLDALPMRILKGTIDTIVPVKSPSARTFLVRVLVDDLESDGSVTLTPGMSAHGLLSMDSDRRAVIIPRDAVLRFQDGRVTVWVVDSSADIPVVNERTVTTGLEFDGVVEIVDGLSGDEVVVVRGNEALQEGQAVTLVDGTL